MVNAPRFCARPRNWTITLSAVISLSISRLVRRGLGVSVLLPSDGVGVLVGVGVGVGVGVVSIYYICMNIFK